MTPIAHLTKSFHFKVDILFSGLGWVFNSLLVRACVSVCGWEAVCVLKFMYESIQVHRVCIYLCVSACQAGQLHCRESPLAISKQFIES